MPAFSLVRSRKLPGCFKEQKTLDNKEAEPTRGVEPSITPEKLVHASIVNLINVRKCKRPNGEDWLLGMGSCSMVYKAKMGKLDVAVKTSRNDHNLLSEPHLPPQEALQAISKELRMRQMVPFDNRIVQLYGSCSLDGNIFMVLEFMEGGDLRNAMKGHFAPALRWYNHGAGIALDIIKGIQFLHSRNIMHWDLRSSNVLLSKDCDSVKICDVGLARMMSNSIMDSSHNVMTSFTYAAPEVVMCQRSDQRADIFSYGVLLWELITQETPQRGNLRDLQIPQECPQEISDMVAACTSQLASDRPTAQQIIRVMESSMINHQAGYNSQAQEDA
ncbi:hypothetical protein ABBQ32_000259 [Trebouxia sp. C0010 RCD-2024]